MRVVYCADPLDPKKPDAIYELEAKAAISLGITYDLINFEALVYDHSPSKAVRKVEAQPELSLAVYRGWMLKLEDYQQLYEALASKNLSLVNDPASYKHCHYLPESYALIEGLTPRSVWTTRPDTPIDEIMPLLRPFGSGPLVLKDYVKSRKHEWEEACYIPSASDREGVEKVVRRFVELQGEDLNGGLVFREFIEFEKLAKHSKSGMPLTKEFRLFFFNGELIYWANYWEEGDYEELTPPLDQFREVGRKIQSRFFTMDVAKQANGDWLIVELGDAQVAGLPEKADVLEFYTALKQAGLALETAF